MQFGLRKQLNFKTVTPLIIVITVIILGGGFYLYQSQKNQVEDNPQVALLSETAKIVEEVGKLTELPTGENPTITTITDVSQLQDQPFFKNAKNGDKVLIYINAQKAILYNPLTKKVTDIAFINIGTASAQEEPEEKKEPLPKIVLRNGTQTLGLTTKIESRLKKDGVKFETTQKENAQKQDYKKTVIVVVNESARDIAESMANILEATVGALPKGEKEIEDADIVIILGKDAT